MLEAARLWKVQQKLNRAEVNFGFFQRQGEIRSVERSDSFEETRRGL